MCVCVCVCGDGGSGSGGGSGVVVVGEEDEKSLWKLAVLQCEWASHSRPLAPTDPPSRLRVLPGTLAANRGSVSVRWGEWPSVGAGIPSGQSEGAQDCRGRGGEGGTQ
jgi:hypothetical protein